MKALYLVILFSFSFLSGQDECSQMNESECSDESFCEWIEDYEILNCDDFNEELICDENFECNWHCCGTMWGGQCLGAGYCCDGGTYQLDNSYCNASIALGDINGDTIFNILDIVILVGMILNGEYDLIADTNVDGTLNILDVVTLINWILVDIPFACDELIEVELWGECYNIENTTEIDLSGNASNGWEGGLTGGIPSEIGDLVNLIYLNLGHNNIMGSIPPEVGNLVNLIYLVIHFNGLSGEIPQEVCSLIESNNLDMSWILNGNNLIYTCR